ncbi:hypothetical protein [uncultured Algimonas sp.]|uniref:hypothetical protein n=1 Tax=uncultured Algimonas sp. TaxID=1547920 RepID=UPI00260C462E|nr:hypothetical protein [uncultured Algimonas sp.]
MLRLLFCTAAILPIGIIPWVSTKADTVEMEAPEASYAELVKAPNIDALSNCETGELPVFFHDSLVTTHSAEFILDGLEAAEDCGDVDVTIIPVLPEGANAADMSQSVQRTAELSEYVEAAADAGTFDVALDIAKAPTEEEISTLYINGRAAILRIDPESSAE